MLPDLSGRLRHAFRVHAYRNRYSWLNECAAFLWNGFGYSLLVFMGALLIAALFGNMEVPPSGFLVIVAIAIHWSQGALALFGGCALLATIGVAGSHLLGGWQEFRSQDEQRAQRRERIRSAQPPVRRSL